MTSKELAAKLRHLRSAGVLEYVEGSVTIKFGGAVQQAPKRLRRGEVAPFEPPTAEELQSGAPGAVTKPGEDAPGVPADSLEYILAGKLPQPGEHDA